MKEDDVKTLFWIVLAKKLTPLKYKRPNMVPTVVPPRMNYAVFTFQQTGMCHLVESLCYRSAEPYADADVF